MKIADYKIIVNGSEKEFEDEIKELTSEGWNIHGHLLLGPDFIYTIAMIKYESDPKESRIELLEARINNLISIFSDIQKTYIELLERVHFLNRKIDIHLYEIATKE